MSSQPEQVLESQLIDELQKLGYTKVNILDEDALLKNLKTQLEKHNNLIFSGKEFERVLNILSKGTIFEKAKILRERQHIKSDNEEDIFFDFLNTEQWCQNQYQVAHQITMEGKYKNRYDVTLLVNGLPLVQIELKRRGIEMKEAFNQINRYQNHSFGASTALFQYVQLFVISNGVNTKYFANNKHQSFKQTFYWTDEKNRRITDLLNGFTDTFLEPCHISKMISKYIVLSESDKILMVLRPYQFYAVENIVNKVKKSNTGGYIWHTTGSGKTLTSFKASQIITKIPEVEKVIFVVDRKDLDYQTIKEFNSFSKGSIDGTNNTKTLVNQFSDDTKIIVTTIQKLNTAISKKKYLDKMERLKNQRIVFIFDECHRSQFGETHNRIVKFFQNYQMFGFTGTPILQDNAIKNKLGKRTTKQLFGDCLHKYVITDAIKDENVLKFSVEYVGRYKRKETSTEIDIEVEDIDVKELMESDTRIDKITDYIIANHDKKTQSRKFTAMFCVSNTDVLVKYYEAFKRKKSEGKHNLKIATIFSFNANEEDPDADGFIPDETAEVDIENVSKYKRDKLEDYVADFNTMFSTNHSIKDSQSFYNYYNDISKKVREKKVDILLVVNMFLTGFDSKPLNTLYVDKNLKYHGLIQAYSRTNRILNELKSQGNIVVFRNLKAKTDEAITLFSNKEAIDVIIMEPYDDYVNKFNIAFAELLKITPTVKSVDDLLSEEDELNFIKAFRNLMRVKNIIDAFADFKWQDLAMNEQLFNDYKSKYLDLWQKTKTDIAKEKVSILNDVDFELELLHKDEINGTYILKLLSSLKEGTKEEQKKKKEHIFNLLSGEASLKSKQLLIQKFIEENLPYISDEDSIDDEFDKFWQIEQKKALNEFVEKEKLSKEKTIKIIENYIFSERKPIRDELLNLIEGGKPSVLKRKSVGQRILNGIVEFVETFIDGM